ncbi:hypothetical protein LTR86_003496 [Recurvomyces mirabilis]|nr:hypothetical protein LTR86_003496 [Recurvomyces mirabilis]
MMTSYTKIEPSSEDSEALLTHRTSDESDQRWLDEALQQQAQHRQATPRVRVALTALVVLLMTNIVLSATNLAQWRSRRTTADLGLYSPAQVAVQPQAKFIDASFGATNMYKGSRSPGLDRAWHDLFENQNIRVTKEELERANKTSVELADGSGWYGVPVSFRFLLDIMLMTVARDVEVYHLLHCLKAIRQYIYEDEYERDPTMGLFHIDHCIDQLRQEVTCKADVTLIGFEWVPNNTDPSPVFQGWHECKNFEAIDAWAKERRFDIFEDELLVHPALGTSSCVVGVCVKLSYGRADRGVCRRFEAEQGSSPPWRSRIIEDTSGHSLAIQLMPCNFSRLIVLVV